MKLLLTSNGFSNQAIVDTLFSMAGRKASDLTLVFIPTASNIEAGDKGWFIDDLLNIKKQGFKSIAITDISAVPKDVWVPQLEEADVLFFEGGNTYHLMKWMNQSGLVDILPDLLKERIYVGVSAGSMVTAPDLNLRLSKVIYGEDAETESVKGLGYTDFYFLPHLNSPHFLVRKESMLTEAMKGITRKTYALDDQSALEVADGQLRVVGGGHYLEFN